MEEYMDTTDLNKIEILSLIKQIKHNRREKVQNDRVNHYPVNNSFLERIKQFILNTNLKTNPLSNI